MCLVRYLGASLGPIVASGGDNTSPRPRPIVRWLVGGLSGDCADDGGRIDATDATSRSGGIRDGGGRVWVGFDGNLEAARHGGVVVLAVCCDHSLFCADSLYYANSLYYKLSAQNKLSAQFKVITRNNM